MAQSTDTLIDRKLRAAWRRQRQVTHLRAGLLLLAWLLALLLVGLAVDWLFLLPGYARLLLVLAILGTLGYVAWQRWWRDLRRYDPVRMALQVEREHPELENLLVSFVQLRDAPVGTTSPALIAATLDQARTAAEPTKFTDIIDVAELKRISLVALIIALVFAATSTGLSSFVTVYFKRLVDPTATAGYPTRTQILATSGELVVLKGEPVTLAADAQGLLPTEGTLHIKPSEGRWEELTVSGTAEGHYSHSFPQVIDSFDYYLEIGDARSDRHTVRVVPPPTPTTVAIELDYPDYTGQETRTVSDLNFQAPQDTRVTWRLSFDRPITDAILQPATGESAEPMPLKLADGGRSATLQLDAQQSLPYTFAWTDQEHGFRYEGEVRHVMQVVPDRAPDVRLLEPRDDMPATLNRTLPIQYQAIDDFGLSNAWIVYAIGADPEQRLPLDGLTGRSATRSIDWLPREDIRNLAPGDVLTYAIEVSDNRNGGREPNLGRSNARRLFILSEADYLRAMLERRQEILEQVDELHGQQGEAKDVLRGVELRGAGQDESAEP